MDLSKKLGDSVYFRIDNLPGMPFGTSNIVPATRPKMDWLHGNDSDAPWNISRHVQESGHCICYHASDLPYWFCLLYQSWDISMVVRSLGRLSTHDRFLWSLGDDATRKLALVTSVALYVVR